MLGQFLFWPPPFPLFFSFRVPTPGGQSIHPGFIALDERGRIQKKYRIKHFSRDRLQLSTLDEKNIFESQGGSSFICDQQPQRWTPDFITLILEQYAKFNHEKCEQQQQQQLLFTFWVCSAESKYRVTFFGQVEPVWLNFGKKASSNHATRDFPLHTPEPWMQE